MPSIPHEGPIDLVRQYPEIAVEFARSVAGISLPGAVSASLAPTDMSAVVPVQYLADMVVLIADAITKEPLLAVIIEPQLRDNRTKRFSWPVYVATARQVSKCAESVLIVLCPDPVEAAKCRQPIRTGHPGFDLVPIVIDSSGPPGQDGSGIPYLTMFAASMGGIDLESELGARRLLDAMAKAEVSVSERLRMTTIILRLASDAARQILEAMMKTSEYEKTFVERIHDEGKAEGKAENVLQLLEARHLAPSPEQRSRVTSCTDLAQLDRWFGRALAAATVAEVFAD
jgi:hypothetical protein